MELLFAKLKNMNNYIIGDRFIFVLDYDDMQIGDSFEIVELASDNSYSVVLNESIFDFIIEDEVLEHLIDFKIMTYDISERFLIFSKKEPKVNYVPGTTFLTEDSAKKWISDFANDPLELEVISVVDFKKSIKRIREETI